MNAITIETRKKSYQEVKQSLSKRENEVLDALGNEELTANEIAYKLYDAGRTPFFNRNYVHPRLNELMNWGIVETVNKRKCGITGKTCAVYRKIVENVDNCVDNTTKCENNSQFEDLFYEMDKKGGDM